MLALDPAIAKPPAGCVAKAQGSPGGFHLLVIVRDENGVVVPAARVTLTSAGLQAPLRGATNYAGRQEFTGLAAGTYQLRVEKEGFYEVNLSEVRVDEAESLEVTLNHLQEYKETVHVVYSPQTIDPTQTATTQNLSSQEIIELPYPTTRDIRNALPLMPGVLPDKGGQVHVEGSASNQVLYMLDGFNITQPVSGLLDLRVSTDAVRSVEVLSSRTSPEFGRGSGGVLNVGTGMGDDHLRFSATDFIPSFQQRRGFHFQNATPRFSLSGPVRKGKAWFYEAVEGEYDLNIFSELPVGADRNHFWRMSNLARAQVNLTPGNRLIGSVVVNRSNEDHAGLSVVRPFSTTTDQTKSAYLITLKDQATWANGMLLELGFGFNQYGADKQPLGALPYALLPGSATGNFYRASSVTARRFEALANFFFPPFEWHGQHQFTVGTNLERINDDVFVLRRPFSILRNGGTLERAVSFTGSPRFEMNNFTASGFVQDHWSLSSRLLLEQGLRLDVDEVLRQAVVSPRFATTYLLTQDGETKLSAGVGLYYDRTDLELLARPLAGRRQDVFFAPDGVTPLGPAVVTTFEATPRGLEEPRFLNWSVGLERKLPASVYLKAEFLQKRGVHGLDYENEKPVAGPSGVPSSGLFVLRNRRRDRYDGLTLTFRRAFKRNYAILVAYTRSSARSNAVLDSTMDNPLFSPQLGGPLPWDSPNRVVSWGWVPLIRRFDFAYALDWHDGFPFSLVNQEQELVALPNRSRFPDYFTLNIHIEKRLRLFGFEWALRAGFNNVTDRKNPGVVNNNVDSPTFGTFSAFQSRAFTGRIRFLGRK